MSYSSVAQCSADPAFTARVNACIAQEQLAKDQPPRPGDLILEMLWAVAGANDVEAAYASALAAENPDPGGDRTVITDEMILSNVQAHWPA